MAARAARCAGPTAELLGAGGEAEGAPKLVVDIGVTDARRTGSGDDEHVAGWCQLDAVAAKELAHQPANPVARRRITDLAARGDAEARWWVLSLADDHDEVGGGLA